MKKCELNCEFMHEGFCAAEELTGGVCTPKDCKAKTIDDLVCGDCGNKEGDCDE